MGDEEILDNQRKVSGDENSRGFKEALLAGS